jgi:putative tryptophan/tyrosine transport system substrate-binding protein
MDPLQTRLDALEQQMHTVNRRLRWWRGLACTLALGLLVVPRAADTQPPTNIPRIGILCTDRCPAPPLEASEGGKAFLEGLRELGYRQKRDFNLIFRNVGTSYERLPDLAADLVQLQVDVILALEGAAVARAAKHATRTVPIIMVGVPDVVELGLVESLARPGGNLTGMTLPFAELVTKHLELLGALVPGFARVAVLWNPANPEHRPALHAIEQAGRALGVSLQRLELHNHREGEADFAALSPREASGLLVLTDPAFSMARIPLLAIHHRLPTISLRREFAVAGGLMSYGPSLAETYRRAAFYVGRILKGIKPADLPVEQPTRFEFVVNLSTAKAIGLTIPPTLLFQADEVIR